MKTARYDLELSPNAIWAHVSDIFNGDATVEDHERCDIGLEIASKAREIMNSVPQMIRNAHAKSSFAGGFRRASATEETTLKSTEERPIESNKEIPQPTTTQGQCQKETDVIMGDSNGEYASTPVLESSRRRASGSGSDASSATVV